jgi:hypothetical protein
MPSASVTTAISEQRKSIAVHGGDRVQSRRTQRRPHAREQADRD